MSMLIVRIKPEMENDALGRLMAKDVPLKTWKNGETALPEKALELLQEWNIEFEVVGPATYERLTPIRDLSAEAV